VRNRRRRLSAESELNLIPMLDMVSLLIQLLLLNAHFGSLVTVPSLIGRETEEPLDGAAVQLVVSPQGYELSWTESGQREVRHLPCKGACSERTDFDLPGLRSAARDVKRNHPDDRSVTVVLHPSLAFESVADAMDAVRGRAGSLFPDIVLSSAP
jgi:biopolymer transport protein ExbD